MSDEELSPPKVSKLSTKANAFSIESLMSHDKRVDDDQARAIGATTIKDVEDLKGLMMFK